jgi:hypothetical protein
VVLSFGDRRYRVRGLSKNLSYETLKINLHIAQGDAYYVDTFDLYSARARHLYIVNAAKDLAVREVHGPYDQSSKDWTTVARPSKVYVDDGKPCECSNQKLGNAIDQIDALHIGYAPLGYNSNAVVGTALQSLGLSPGDDSGFGT